MMIIAKLKGDASLEEMQAYQKIIKDGKENGCLIYDSNHIDLFIITDKEKENYNAI